MVEGQCCQLPEERKRNCSSGHRLPPHGSRSERGRQRLPSPGRARHTRSVRVFGLTGGVASGKSTVAARFRERGVPVVDADELARRAVAPGTAALQEILETFGRDYASPEGTLDRAKLAARVFGDASALQQLNSIVHPRVAQLFQADLQQLQARGHALVCYEVPLLFENQLHHRLRPVVLVALPRPLQLERAMRRSGWSAEQAAARIDAQLPLAQKRQLADYVIDNDGPLQQTLERADHVLDAIRSAPTGPAA